MEVFEFPPFCYPRLAFKIWTLYHGYGISDSLSKVNDDSAFWHLPTVCIPAAHKRFYEQWPLKMVFSLLTDIEERIQIAGSITEPCQNQSQHFRKTIITKMIRQRRWIVKNCSFSNEFYKRYKNVYSFEIAENFQISHTKRHESITGATNNKITATTGLKINKLNFFSLFFFSPRFIFIYTRDLPNRKPTAYEKSLFLKNG